MNITQEEIVDRQTVMLIEMDDSDLESYLDRSYKRVVKRVNIPGFRKGKAPRVMVERYLSREYLLNDSLDFMIPEITRKAIDSQNLETVGMPSIDLVSMDPFSLKATVALTPVVELGAYKDLRLDQTYPEITEDDVDGKLKEQIEAASSWEPAQRPAKMGDMLTMNVRGVVDDRTIVEESDQVYVAEENSKWPFEGFVQHLDGVEIGVHKQFTETIPSNYTDSSLADKKATFEVNVSEIKERISPELNDEFARSLDGNHETLTELRENIMEELIEESKRVSDAEYRDSVLQELAKGSTIELPPLLIKQEVDRMIERRNRFVESLQMTLDDYLRYTGKSEEEVAQDMEEEARDRFARSYTLSTFAELEGIVVDEKEINSSIEEMKEAQGSDARALKQRGLDSDEVKESVRENLVLRKALDKLASVAKDGPEVPVTDDATEQGNQNAPSEDA